MKVLVTGFVPFNKGEFNPAETAVTQMKAPPGVEVDKIASMPVSFAEAANTVVRRFLETRPDAVVMVGLAGGREGISVERVALNLADATIPDNDGRQPEDETVDRSGPTAILSTAPVKQIVAALREEGISARVSLTAGTFVCNHVYYTLLRTVQLHMLPTRVVFIHVPYADHQRAAEHSPHMSMDLITRAVEIAVANV